MTALSIEQILAQDPHVVMIHPPLYKNILSIDLGLFNSEKKNTVERMFQVVNKYLTYPLIEDNFGTNHPERREWRKEMEKLYGDSFTEYYQKNKLRGGVFGYTINALRAISLNALGEKKEDLTRKVIELTHLFPDQYDLLSSSQKIKTMRTVEEKVYDFLLYVQVPKK